MRSFDIKLVSIIAVFLVSITLPFLIADRLAGENHVFEGFLINPGDGNTYLAKMQQGFSGEWKVQLLHNREPGAGAYFLFAFYLLLGHLARIFNLPLIVTFHICRALGGLALAWMLYRFLTQYFGDGYRHFYLILALFGSGLGWLALAAGRITSDLWVAEMYPFLSSYANPHFPLGLAMMLAISLRCVRREAGWAQLTVDLLLGFVLGLIAPFGLAVCMAAGAAWSIWTWIESREFHWKRLAACGLGGGIIGGYEVLVTRIDPVFANWNAQNVMLTEPAWEVITALSPAFIFALAGIWFAYRRGTPLDRLLIAWAAIGMISIYIPLDLQRRFSMGLYVPFACLGCLGFCCLTENRGRLRLALAAALCLSLPTNLLVVSSGMAGAYQKNPAITMTKGEALACEWMAENTEGGALILASPESGNYIPGRTGRRVLYGHTVETVEAEKNLDLTMGLFSKLKGTADIRPELEAMGVDYIFFGPREMALTDRGALDGFEQVYRSRGVSIYEVGHEK